MTPDDAAARRAGRLLRWYPKAWRARFGEEFAELIVFLGGCCSWVLGGGPGPGNLFHVGAIDMAVVAVLTIALTLARRAAYQARRAGRGLGAR